MDKVPTNKGFEMQVGQFFVALLTKCPKKGLASIGSEPACFLKSRFATVDGAITYPCRPCCPYHRASPGCSYRRREAQRPSLQSSASSRRSTPRFAAQYA